MRVNSATSPGPSRVLTAWMEGDEVFIRESIDRGKDVQTVALSLDEMQKIIDSARKGLL